MTTILGPATKRLWEDGPVTKISVVIPGSDPESKVVRDWIQANRESNFTLANDVLSFSNPIAPVRGRSETGGYLLIAPRDPHLVEQMRARYPALVTIDHVSRLDEPGYDFAGKPSCLTQFYAIAKAAGTTFQPRGNESAAAISAAVSGGLPAFARRLWAEAGQPELPGHGTASALTPPRKTLTAACQKDARTRWNDCRDRREPEPHWRGEYAKRHHDIITRYAALWGGGTRREPNPFGITGKRVILDCGTRQAPDDPRLILARIEADPVRGHELDQLIARAESWAFDALYKDDSRSVPSLLGADLIFLLAAPGAQDDKAPWAVVALAGGARRALFAEIADPRTGTGAGVPDLSLEGMAAADRVRLIWCSPDDRPHAALHKVVTHLLDDLLGGNRPLVAWRTSWLQFVHHTDRHAFERLRRELALCAEAPTRKKVTREEFSPEVRAYFLDQVRPTLDLQADERVRDGDDTVLLSFNIDAEMALEIFHLHYRDHLQIACRAFRVHFLYASCIVFEWSAEGEDDSLAAAAREGGEAPWWMNFLDGTRSGVPNTWLTLAEFLDRNRHARFIYSPFHAKSDREIGSRHVVAGTVNGQDMSPVFFGMGFSETAAGYPIDPLAPQGWLRALVRATYEEVFGAGEAERMASALVGTDGGVGQLRLVEDERAHVITSAVIAGSRPGRAATATEYDALLYRALEIEAFGPGFPCDKAFARRELDDSHYTRFAASGSDFLVSDHSFAYLGFGSYALDEIHEKHMRTAYHRMFLFAQLHAAILNVFTIEFRQAHRDDDEWQQGEILRRFGRFTSQVWCDEVTTQVEGAELFELMRKRASAGSQYGYLHSAIEEASERANTQIVTVLSVLGFLGVGFLFIKAPVHAIGSCLIGQLNIFGQFPFLLASAYGLVWAVDRLVKHSIGRSLIMSIWGLRYLAPFRIAEDKRVYRLPLWLQHLAPKQAFDDRRWLLYRSQVVWIVLVVSLILPFGFNTIRYQGFRYCSIAGPAASANGRQTPTSAAHINENHAGAIAHATSRSSH